MTGLARWKNEAMDHKPEDLDEGIAKKYNLAGMVVHSTAGPGRPLLQIPRPGS